MALPYRVQSKTGGKMRPKSLEIARTQSDWKSSFENRKSVFEQNASQPLNRKYVSSMFLEKQPTAQKEQVKEVRKIRNGNS